MEPLHQFLLTLRPGEGVMFDRVVPPDGAPDVRPRIEATLKAGNVRTQCYISVQAMAASGVFDCYALELCLRRAREARDR